MLAVIDHVRIAQDDYEPAEGLALKRRWRFDRVHYMFYSMPHPLLPDQRLANRAKGRGARTNTAGRFERHCRSSESDGWDISEYLPPLRTEVTEEPVRRILTRNASPDLNFDRSVNPYRGCEHGCVYCFARPSHGYLGLSAGLDFETRLTAKPGAAEALDRELRAVGYRPAPIAIGTNTDAYQPLERDRRIMRDVLQVLSAFRHPVGIVTKGSLVERDVDILSEMAGDSLARVGLSITTLDAGLSRSMEPRVPSPARRLRTIERLSRAGVPVRVCVSPVIPGLTDHEIEAILQAARDAGAIAASSVMLRLPHEVAPLVKDWLEETRPDRAARVMGLVRDCHGGKEYDARFGLRGRGQGAYAMLLRQRFHLARRRLGLAHDLPAMRTDLFAPPPRAGDQLSLF